MNEKYDGTRMIHGECRLEATSPWADGVVLEGLRLHLDLHIVPRGSTPASSRGASAALRRASTAVGALCFGVRKRPERALLAGMAVFVIAFALWAMHGPSGSHGPSTELPAAPSVAKTPEPSPVPAARHPIAPPPARVAPLSPKLIVPPHAGSPPAALPKSPAADEKASSRSTAATPESTASRLAKLPARAVRSFAKPASSRATSDRDASVTAPSPSPPATGDMLDLFGDTK